MRENSTMTTLEFVFSVIWKYMIGFVWYKNLLFRVLPHRDVYDSIWIINGRGGRRAASGQL